MTSPLPGGIPIGGACRLFLRGGHKLGGKLVAADEEWLVLESARGRDHVRLDQVVAVRTGTGAGAGAGRREAAADDGPDWTVDELRAIVDAFLDGETDADLASRFGGTKRRLADLRKAFECARGNLVEDQVPPAAQRLIAPLREALQGG